MSAVDNELKATSPVKRTVARLRHPMRKKFLDTAHEVTNDMTSDDLLPAADEAHITTAEYAASAGYAIVKEVAKYLQGDEGKEALRGVFVTQTQVVADIAVQLLLSDEIKQAARMAGQEIVLGSSIGVERRMSTEWERLPKFVTVSIFPVAVIFGGLLVLGLLLALWRFAIFGLQ